MGTIESRRVVMLETSDLFSGRTEDSRAAVGKTSESRVCPPWRIAMVGPLIPALLLQIACRLSWIFYVPGGTVAAG